MGKVNGRVWRTERFVVEIPVQGALTAKDMQQHVEDMLDGDEFLRRVTKQKPYLAEGRVTAMQLGRVRVKSLARYEQGKKNKVKA